MLSVTSAPSRNTESASSTVHSSRAVSPRVTESGSAPNAAMVAGGTTVTVAAAVVLCVTPPTRFFAVSV